jgi:hypothetical protein
LELGFAFRKSSIAEINIVIDSVKTSSLISSVFIEVRSTEFIFFIKKNTFGSKLQMCSLKFDILFFSFDAGSFNQKECPIL